MIKTFCDFCEKEIITDGWDISYKLDCSDETFEIMCKKCHEKIKNFLKTVKD